LQHLLDGVAKWSSKYETLPQVYIINQDEVDIDSDRTLQQPLRLLNFALLHGLDNSIGAIWVPQSCPGHTQKRTFRLP
jgi:hypothetical protein